MFEVRMAILQRVVKYEPVPAGVEYEFITLEEAAKMLGITNAAVRLAMNSGRLTEFIDTDKTWQGRRLALRSEVLALAAERTQNP